MRRHGKCDSLNTEMVMQNCQIRQNPQICPVSVEDASARIWKMPLSPIERWWWKPSTRRGTGLEDPQFPEILRGSPWQKNNAHQRRLKQPWLFRYLDRIWKTCGFPEHDNFSGRPYISMSFSFHVVRCFLWDAVALRSLATWVWRISTHGWRSRGGVLIDSCRFSSAYTWLNRIE